MDGPSLKTELRKTILARRDALSLADRLDKSGLIAERLEDIPEYVAATTVMFYVEFRSEVVTLPMLDAALKAGKRVVVPKVDKAAHRLDLYEIKDPAHELETGYMGIPEPVPALARKAKPEDIDLVILPGVGFDTSCGRLGYGGGYYDRLIETLRPDVSLVALAFEAQLVDEVPCDPHDRRVGKVITEKRVIAA